VKKRTIDVSKLKHIPKEGMVPGRKVTIDDMDFYIRKIPGKHYKYDWSIRCIEIGTIYLPSKGMTDSIADSFCEVTYKSYKLGKEKIQNDIKNALSIKEGPEE